MAVKKYRVQFSRYESAHYTAVVTVDDEDEDLQEMTEREMIAWEAENGEPEALAKISSGDYDDRDFCLEDYDEIPMACETVAVDDFGSIILTPHGADAWTVKAEDLPILIEDWIGSYDEDETPDGSTVIDVDVVGCMIDDAVEVHDDHAKAFLKLLRGELQGDRKLLYVTPLPARKEPTNG